MTGKQSIRIGDRVRLIHGMFRGAICTVDDIDISKGYPVYSLKNTNYTCPLHYSRSYMEICTNESK